MFLAGYANMCIYIYICENITACKENYLCSFDLQESPALFFKLQLPDIYRILYDDSFL